MNFLHSRDRIGAALALVLCTGLMSMAGCGTPGAPQPPSLHMPERVTDLTAVRAGGSVTLHWTMPRKTTDHLLIKSQVPVGVCWREAAAGECHAAGQAKLDPGVEVGADGKFHEALPVELSAGSPRAVSYFVELKSPKGRSAGLSNPAVVVAGTAPAPVEGLSAEVHADGVALHWNSGESGAVRLHRKLLTPAALAKKSAREKSGNAMATPAPEPVLRDLMVTAPEAGPNAGALDKTARFGEVYEYTAQRVAQVSVNGSSIDGPGGKTSLELLGEISAPVRVDVVDIFPPAVPQGLVAVLVPEEKTIDLSWQPDTDEDLAGYIVYRAAEDGAWQRISGAQPLIGPAYRDAAVAAGHAYRYAVSAIDLTGHESKRSVEAQENFPNP